MVILRNQCICINLWGLGIQKFPNHVCRLQKSLYGLKQAPRACIGIKDLLILLLKLGLFIALVTIIVHLQEGSTTTYLLLYVDDIILTTFSSSFFKSIFKILSSEFGVKDLGI